MPTHRFRRPFASGSKPTPDPYDSYLEKEGFYRKHVPRDAASLFRVMSEQIYDSQNYHEKIRKDCVNFMIKHRNKYEDETADDFEKYTRKMVEIQTPGTLLELKVMSHMFERNIYLYRPFDLGVWFINELEYKKKPLVRVFCTNEGHFDSVYTKSHIIKAGFCQSIVYETLYKNVFKLPDIEYSVEVMLHSTNDQESNIVFAETEYANDDEYATHIVFEDGRKFQLDRPEDTNCILKDPKLCHFHNMDFEKTAKELNNRPHSMFGGSYNFIKSSLSDKHASCVRQLLNDGITPFSYKVAKALDPDMYRNVEFDSWSDARRNIRMKYGWHLQIGEKCLVSLDGEKRPLCGYIQDIDEQNQSCIVYIDELCEKRTVSICCMRPLNVNTYESKKYKCGKGGKGDRKYNTFDFNKRAHNSDFLFEFRSDHCDAIYKTDNLNQFTNISNFQNPHDSYEIVAYPIQYTANAKNMAANSNNNASANAVKNTKNRNSSGQNHGHVIVQSAEKVQQLSIMKNDEKNGNAHNKIQHEQRPNDLSPVNNNPIQQHQLDQQPSSGAIDPVQQMPMNQYSYAVRNGTHVYYPQCEFADQPPSEMVPNQQFFVVPPNAYQAAPVQGYATHPNHVAAINYVPMQYGQWPAYNPQGYVHAPAQPIQYAVQPSMSIIRSDLLISNGRPNYNANYSFSPMADDLSIHDQYTIRFYFNLGIEYWKQLQSIHGIGPLMAMIDGEAFEQAPSDVDSQHTDATAGFQQITLEESITTPTPPKGNGKHYNDSYIGRRGTSFRGSNYKRDNRDSRDNRDNRDNRPNPGQRFQGTFPGPTKTFNSRNGPKYHGGHNDNPNNGRNNSYDSTPIKDVGHKPYQHTGGNNNNAINKRETYVPVNEIPNPNITFGSNVPPFPYHLGPPPVNAIPRITPPAQERSAGVSPHEPIEFYNSGQHYNQYNLYTPHVQAPFVNHLPQIHHQMPTNFWMIPPQPNQANNQAQAQAQVQVQSQAQLTSNSQALNTSNVSNNSSTGSNPSN